MLKNFSTKIKLMLVPIVYIMIVTIVAIIFTYYNNLVKFRIEAATQTEIFIQQVLKGRITVYQFLRTPSEANAEKVVVSFENLDKNVSDLKAKVSQKSNKQIADNILKESSEYVKYFKQLSQQKIKDYSNGILEDSEELKPILSKMVNSGLKLEEELNKINESAQELRTDAESTMTSILIVIVLISIFIFIIFSIILSNMINSSIEKFKNGLSSFFAYINRESE